GASEKSDHRHRRLLRASLERPRRRRAAQTADEISTSEQTAQHVFSTLSVSIISVCRRDGRGLPYRFGEVCVATLALLIFTRFRDAVPALSLSPNSSAKIHRSSAPAIVSP